MLHASDIDNARTLARRAQEYRKRAEASEPGSVAERELILLAHTCQRRARQFA